MAFMVKAYTSVSEVCQGKLSVIEVMNKYLSIGYRIASIRNMVHLTQTKFSRAIGISPSFLSELESGKTKPSIPILFAMEYKFHCRYEWVLTGDDPIYLQDFSMPVTMPISGYETPDRSLNFWFDKVIRIFEEGDKAKVELLKAQLRSLDPGAKKQTAEEGADPPGEKKAM